MADKIREEYNTAVAARAETRTAPPSHLSTPPSMMATVEAQRWLPYALLGALIVLQHTARARVVDARVKATDDTHHHAPVARRFALAHLQEEIEAWKKLGLPTELEFPHRGNVTAKASLIALPKNLHDFDLHEPDDDHPHDIIFYLFNRDNEDGVVVTKDVNDLIASGWRANKPTKIVIHGFGNNIRSDVFNYLVPSLLKNGEYNVIGVDWGKLAAKPFYITARSHVAGVGKVVAQLVDFLVENNLLQLKDLHVIGHSLGAHVAGNVGKNVKSGTVARITGLDPAMPLFLLFVDDRLSKNDATVVDVVHTCAGFLGLSESIGHVDFYPNGGKNQPGCGLDLFGICRHKRSFQLFAESAFEKDAFLAELCPSEDDALGARCDASNVAGEMGINLQYKVSGAYYLVTADSEPFDLNAHRKSRGGHRDYFAHF